MEGLFVFIRFLFLHIPLLKKSKLNFLEWENFSIQRLIINQDLFVNLSFCPDIRELQLFFGVRIF